MIRSSRHYFDKKTNKNKIVSLNKLVDNYKKAVEYFIDYLWNNTITWKNNTFSIKDNELSCPSMISTKGHEIEGLSQRIIKCAATQACGMVKSATELQRKRLYVYSIVFSENLKKIIDETVLVKPTCCEKFKCEINSICADVRERDVFSFLQLKSLGEINKFRLPFKHHRQSLKWKKKGKLLNSFLVSKNSVELRWEIPENYKGKGKIVGADQGKLTALTMSDGQKTVENNNKQDLTTIINKLARRKKGSKGFERAQDHRKNYINWSINQLNLDDIKQINFEKLYKVRYKQNKGRKMSHWTYTLIKNKLMNFAQENGVHINEQSCTYRSQRCSRCGLVLKSNRKGKAYSCVQCGYADDADFNASCNHEQELFELPFNFRRLKLNIHGFFWKENGLFDLNGKELAVPCTNKI